MSGGTPPGIGFARFVTYPVSRVPDKVAVIDEKDRVTFAQMDEWSNRLARAFLRCGAQAGDRVALVLPNSIAFIVTEIAIIKAGMVKVPLNYRFHPKEVAYALADCEPAIVVCDAAYLARLAPEGALPGSVKGIVAVGEATGALSYDETIRQGDASPLSPLARPDAPILIRYTGGTTGRAKGIVHTDSSLTNMHRDLISEFTIREWDVALHLGHLSHGSNFAWAAFYGMGATQIVRERFDPKAVLKDIERFRVTFTYMVPTMLQRVLRDDDGRADVSSLTRVWVSSAPIPVPVIRQAIGRFGNIFSQAYTLSECPPVSTILRPDEIVDKNTRFGPRIGSCGREALTQEIRLLDNDGNEVADGEVGEIVIRSVNNMSEYWRLPDETRKTLVDGWLRTGDLAGRDEEGYLYIVDRKKDVIITGGFNVYPKEIEDVIYTHAGVAAVGVVGVPDEELGETVVAYVVVRDGAKVAADELIQLCRENLASYKKPRGIRFVSELPLTPVGKVSRRELRDLARRTV